MVWEMVGLSFESSTTAAAVAAIDYTSQHSSHLCNGVVFVTTISHHLLRCRTFLFYLFNFMTFLCYLWMMAPCEERHRNGSN